MGMSLTCTQELKGVTKKTYTFRNVCMSKMIYLYFFSLVVTVKSRCAEGFCGIRCEEECDYPLDGDILSVLEDEIVI